MKSTIFSILPFMGLAFAQESACPAEPEETITETSVEVVYETATPTPTLVTDATTSSDFCKPSTVSVTTTEKVYITVSYTPDSTRTIDVTSTSTLNLYTTVTVHPSGGYFVNSTTAALFKPSSATTLLNSTSATHTPIPPPRPKATKSTLAAPKPTASTPPSPYAASAPRVMKTRAGVTKRGSATWYAGNISGGTCSFVDYTIPAGIYGTAISDLNWDSAGICGTCLNVKGPRGNMIKVMAVDQCPGCGPNHLDIFTEGFAAIENLNAGNITVDWTVVPCGISSPIVLKNKSGTSKFWFSMQVMNSNIGVAKLEVSTDGGASWKQTKRQPYNFFENASGFGTDAVDVRVTSTDGKTIMVKNVSIKSESKTTAGGNFA